MRQKFWFPLLIFIGLLSAAAASADTSTRGCETNTMKAGSFCNWAEAKSWCNGNTNTCEVESVTACPSNPTGGSYAFSCNVNSCVLTCDSGYTNCAGVCHPNVAVPSNCTSFNQCTDTCSACAQGYELSGGVCIGATLRLGADSVGSGNHIFQSSSPSVNVLSSGFVGIGTTSPTARLEILPSSGYSILAGDFKIGNVALPTLNSDAATKGYVDAAISSATSSGGLPSGIISQTLRHNGTTWVASSNLFNDGTNVGIGTTSPTANLHVVGKTILSYGYPAGALNIGADVNSTTRSANVRKLGVISAIDCSNTKNIEIFTSDSGTLTDNNVYFGGRPGGSGYAATDINFVTATTTSTIGGTTRMSIDRNGQINMYGGVRAVNVATGRYIQFAHSGDEGAISTNYGPFSFGPATGLVYIYKAGVNNTLRVYGSSGSSNHMSMTHNNSYGSLTTGVGPLVLGSATGNIGIGTTTPLARLEVVPASGYSILAGNYRIGNVALPIANEDAATKGYVDSSIASATSSGGLPAGTISQTLRHNGTTWVASSNLFNNGTNVGIGTTTPIYALDIAGNVRANGVFIGKDIALGTYSGIWFNQATPSVTNYAFLYGGGTFLNAPSGQIFAMRIANSNRLIINTNGVLINHPGDNIGAAVGVGLAVETGNVGFGTTTPLARLEVVPASGYSILAGNYRIGNVALPTADTDAATKGYVDASIATATSSGGLPAGTVSQTLRHNGTTWEASSLLFNNGTNIGIGTTTPTATLDVIDTDNNSILNVQQTNASAAYGLSSAFMWFRAAKGNNALRFMAYGDGAGNYIQSGNYGFTGNQPLYFSGYNNNVGSTVSFNFANSIFSNGNVGIGTSTPLARLSVVPASGYSILVGNYRIGNVALPVANEDAATKGYVDSALGTSTAVGFLPLSGGTMTGPIDMGNNNVSNINTLTVNKLNAITIDPLYNIKGINYSTFAPSIAGGVKEEYTGKIRISRLNAAQEYEAIIDFATLEEGSDLWLWHQVIDFTKDSVDVAVTPYGKFAQVYYSINNNKLIFRSDKAVEISYRLTAKRFDWRNWPTRSNDQSTPGLKIGN